MLLPAPDTPLGPGELRVEGNGTAPAPMAVTVVSVEAINPAGPLRIGVAATLIVRVSGTNQPLDLDLGAYDPADYDGRPRPVLVSPHLTLRRLL